MRRYTNKSVSLGFNNNWPAIRGLSHLVTHCFEIGPTKAQNFGERFHVYEIKRIIETCEQYP